MWAEAAALLTVKTIALVSLGAFVGGLAAGAAGFAFGIVATAIWLHAIDPVHSTILVVSGGTIIQAGTIWPLRRAIEPQRLWPFLAAGLIGIPIGVWLLVRTDAHALKIALGVFLAAYGVYALATPRLRRIEGGGRLADAAVGFVGGILGGIGGYSGVLPAIWTQLRGWSKEAARAVYQPFIVMAHVVTLILVGTVAMDAQGAILLLIALPALLAGAAIGWRLYGKLDEHRFRQFLAALLVVSGVTLIF
jgi:uncharacterized membrane protein YfcA